MSLQGRGSAKRRGASRRYGIAALAIAVGVVAATGPDVAWADTGEAGSTGSSVSHAGPTHRGSSVGAKKSGDRHGAAQRRGPAAATPDADTEDPSKAKPAAVDTTPGPGESPRKKPPRVTVVVDDAEVPAATPPVDRDPSAPPADSAPEVTTPKPKRIPDLATVVRLDVIPARAKQTAAPATELAPAPPAALATHTVAALTDRSAPSALVTTTTTIDPVAPTTPAPLSPIAKLLELPGRIVNAVLQLFDMTVAESGPKSPLNFGPISEFLFAAFRRVEEVLGFDEPPAVQHVVPTLTYTGPTDAKTPTVAQFLNASAAAYVLGGAPGGLKPFTVNGFQLQYGNIFSGASARVWVTPEQQVIIAYQGTTGGTNLLFNPLMAISQLLTDLQVIFTDTTPQAFVDSLHFAQRVQAEAAAQGYGTADVFVTGHSLGGWEAQYVAQQAGLAGIGFEGPGINTTVPGNGADSMFVNVATYGDAAAYFSTDLPGLQPFMPPYVPGGGTKPHYGSIVMIGDPEALTPMQNAASLWGTNIFTNLVVMLDVLGNFFQYHLPGVQAYHLDVDPDPGVVTWLGSRRGTVHEGWGELTIQELMAAASSAGRLVKP